MTQNLTSPLRLLSALFLLSPFILCASTSSIIDQIQFGNPSSEQAHNFTSDLSEIIQGGLDDPARQLLPLSSPEWYGGKISFDLKVDSDKQNYFTVRLWGSDTGNNRLILFCDGNQIGYRHLGDIPILDIQNNDPACPGRFFYNTVPLPISLTKGKESVSLEIRSNGSIYAYASDWKGYQKIMKDPTRGIYRVYTHTDGCFVPHENEKQGAAPSAPPVRTQPGEEILAQVKERINKELNGILKSSKAPTQEEMLFLAMAYHIQWTPAFHNSAVIERVANGADQFFQVFCHNPKIVEADPQEYNAGWLGLGPMGQAIYLLGDPLKSVLDEKISSNSGESITRRMAWSEMLQASRDFHRANRRQYTNQSMITDLNIYRSNHGISAIDPDHAMPDEKLRHLLYESLSIEPWLGSDNGNGPQKPMGNDYWQLTPKGLSKELGYVGNYGEILDWATQIYDATCNPGQPQSGDPKIKAQIEKMAKARSYFRYPTLDAEGNRAMRMEAVIGWRDDGHYPGDVTYGERSAWEGSSLFEASCTLSPMSIGFSQQMFADNQFFKSVEELFRQGGLRISKTLLKIPDQYDALKAQSPSSIRLPMTSGQPDFAWADEEDGVVALKHDGEIFYAELYWRARSAVNFLARIHDITPRFDRVAVVQEETEFESSGIEYTRPDWTNFGFGNGGLKYPDGVHSAHAGEKLPIAKVPADAKYKPGDENPYAGRGTFYLCRYGKYLIEMNSSKENPHDLQVFDGATEAIDLISQKIIKFDEKTQIPPQTTVVLCLEK